MSIVPLSVVFDEEPYDDGVLLESQFFEKLESAKKAGTSAPRVGLFLTAYEEAALKGATDIISVHISHVLSVGTKNSAETAAATLNVNFPDVKVHQWDSKFTSMALGWQVLLAAEMAESNLPVEDILQVLKDIRSRTKLMVVLDTLEYVRKGGRIGRARAFLGGILKVKPILALEDGEVKPIERIRTRKKAHAKLVDLVESWGSLERLVVSSGNDFDSAQQVVQLLIDRQIYPGPISYAKISSVLAVHAGPVVGVMAVQEKK